MPPTSEGDRPHLLLDMRTRCPFITEWVVVQKRIGSELRKFDPGWHLWEDILKDQGTLLDCQNAIRSAWANGNMISDRWLEKRMVKTLKQRRYYDKEKVRKFFDVSCQMYRQPPGMPEALFKAIVAELTAPEDSPTHKRQHRGDVGTHSTKRQHFTNAWGQGGYPRFHSNFVRKWNRQPTDEEEQYAKKYSSKELKKKLTAKAQGLDYKCEKELEHEEDMQNGGPISEITRNSNASSIGAQVVVNEGVGTHVQNGTQQPSLPQEPSLPQVPRTQLGSIGSLVVDEVPPRNVEEIFDDLEPIVSQRDRVSSVTTAVASVITALPSSATAVPSIVAAQFAGRELREQTKNKTNETRARKKKGKKHRKE